MNEAQLRNQFRGDLSKLMEDIVRFIECGIINPYSKDSAKTLHEHDTRILFFDRLLTSLGWRLGAYGNIQEEARIKADTTRFMDYVGINQETKTPLMIFEAKAWDVPFVSARNPEDRAKDEDLIVMAIRHILNDKSENESPVSKQWHGFLKQVMDYVRTMKTINEHDTPCAVLSSGQWTVVFTNPVLTFSHGRVSSDDIKIFNLQSYISNADILFNLLHCSVLAKEIPFPLRPAQIKDYIDGDSISTAYYGVHVHYEETGSRFFGPKPQVLIYPVLVLQRNDGVFAAVINKAEGFTLEYANSAHAKREDLTLHLNSVTTCLQELHRICEQELDCKLTISPVKVFPGFTSESYRMGNQTLIAKCIKDYHDEWLLVTGIEKHYLRNMPLIEHCRFHSWADCLAEGCENGTSAINIRSTNPRIIFIDKQMHHCANQIVYDRKRKRCHILQIDERICCQTCNYSSLCWSQEEQEKLPCGK